MLKRSEATDLHPSVKPCLFPWIKNVNVLDVLAAIGRDRNEMVPAFDKGHVVTQLVRATIAIGVEPEFLALAGEDREVQLRLPVVDMGDSVSKKRFAIGTDQPVAITDA